MRKQNKSNILEIGLSAIFLGSAMLSALLSLVFIGSPAFAQMVPCSPSFHYVVPPPGTWGVPISHGINMVFGPADPACSTMCWDTASFHGWLNIMYDGGADTVELGPGDVDFWFGDYPEIGIEYHYSTDWPYGAEIHGGWAIATCDSVYEDGSIYFHVEVDSTPPPPDCEPAFVEVTPPMGTFDVPISHGINMVFGPADPACTTICWDTLSFWGSMLVFHDGICDSVEITPGDVGFWFGDYPELSISSHLPGDWPYDAEVIGGFWVATCDSEYVSGNFHFYTMSDSTPPPPDCDIVFYSADPSYDSLNLPADTEIGMIFGPADSSCDSFCVDTTTFEGIVTIYPGGGWVVDTLFLDASDVDFDLSGWPFVSVTYDPPIDWPYNGRINAYFTLNDCDGHSDTGEAYFHTVYNRPCDIMFYRADPLRGSMDLPGDTEVNIFFGPADSTRCDSFCIDTTTFHGEILITDIVSGDIDTILFTSGVDFDYSDWPIIKITYDPSTDWPDSAEIFVGFNIRDCDSNYAGGNTWFYTMPDSTSDPDCEIMFIDVTPDPGTMDVDSDEPIEMTFGPADPACATFCVDTTTFEGLIVLTPIPFTGARDTVFITSGDVDWDFAADANFDIIYESPTGWADSMEIKAFFYISDCDSNRTHGMTYFYTMPDSASDPDCTPVFVEVTPAYGDTGVSITSGINMVFGPVDPACTTICWDTTSFWGYLSIEHGGIIDTVFGPEDVDFFWGDYPEIGIEYHYPTDWPEGAEISGLWSISNCDGDTAMGSIHFYVLDSTPPDTVFEVTFLEPDADFSACPYQAIEFIVEPYVPDSLIVYVDWGFYILGVAPELSVSGDTVTYTPTSPWAEGVPHVVEVLDGRLEFYADRTAPVFYLISPPEGAISAPVVIEMNLHEPATASGVNLAASTLTIFIDGVPAGGTHSLDETGITYFAPNLTIDIAVLDPAIVFAPGDTVFILFGISDNVSPEYCGPNTISADLHYYIADDRHLLRGDIVDALTDDPLDGIIVHLFNYLGAPISAFVCTTDIDGIYEFDVLPGTYAIGAFDTDGDYLPVFYCDRYDLLFADPIFVDPIGPPIVELDTMHMVDWSGGTLYSVTGTINEIGDGPIDAAYVVAISSEDDEIQDAVITGPTGGYELEIPDGSYIILAFHGSYIPGFYGGAFYWGSADSIVIAGTPVGGIDIELLPMFPDSGDFEIFGCVFSDSIARAIVPTEQRGARVYLLDARSEQIMSATVSDYNGYYTFDNLNVGTYRIIPDLVGYVPAAAWWDLYVDTSATQNVTLHSVTPVMEPFKLAYDFELKSVSPNPFNAACAINFTIDTPGEVVIEVFDVTGRMVETIDNRELKTGEYVTVWQPDGLSSGIYFIRISHDGRGQSEKLLLLK